MIDPSRRVQAIQSALSTGLDAIHVEVIDQSSRHVGHLGAGGGGGHFEVVVVSERFRGLSRVAAQRLVYEALGELMQEDIHALTMRTLTPEQWNSGASSA
jgi:BolA protein